MKKLKNPMTDVQKKNQ